jgi:hypothetical protein
VRSVQWSPDQASLGRLLFGPVIKPSINGLAGHKPGVEIVIAVRPGESFAETLAPHAVIGKRAGLAVGLIALLPPVVPLHRELAGLYDLERRR